MPHGFFCLRFYQRLPDAQANSTNVLKNKKRTTEQEHQTQVTVKYRASRQNSK